MFPQADQAAEHNIRQTNVRLLLLYLLLILLLGLNHVLGLDHELGLFDCGGLVERTVTGRMGYHLGHR